MLASTYIHPPCHLVLLSFFLPSSFLLSTCYHQFPLRVSIPFHCTSQSISLSIPFSACLNPFLYLSQSLSLPVSVSFSACFKSLSPVYLNPFLCLFQSLSLFVSIPFFDCLNPFLCLSQSLTLCLNSFLCLSQSLSRPVSYKNRRSQEVYLAWRIDVQLMAGYCSGGVSQPPFTGDLI
jgi:hypothetical protein